LVRYHKLRVDVELKSSNVHEKLRALDEVQRVTQCQLDDEVKKQKSLGAKADRLQIAKLQSEKNLREVDKKIRFVTQICLSFHALTMLVGSQEGHLACKQPAAQIHKFHFLEIWPE